MNIFKKLFRISYLLLPIISYYSNFICEFFLKSTESKRPDEGLGHPIVQMLAVKFKTTHLNLNLVTLVIRISQSSNSAIILINNYDIY